MKFPMIRVSFIAAAMLVGSLITGCATKNKMAFEDEGDKALESGKPVLLMSATIRNSYKPGYQPKLTVLHIEKPGATSAEDRLNFLMDDKGRTEFDDPAKGNNYLLRMVLEPGQYEIVGMTSFARSFPVMASFFTPLHSKIEVSGSGVIYLGHVEAVVRERQGTEFKAGPTIPLLDQSLSGASGGTFDVTISDAFATDEAMFKERFPALKNVQVRKSVLAPFDRAVAQEWWEKH